MKQVQPKASTLAASIALAFSYLASAPAAAADEEKASAKLITVTVTADPDKGFKSKYVQVGSFRDTQVLDIPMTVNVIPRVVLDAQGAEGLFDALKNTAGVARSQLSGTIYDNIAIRGITVDNRTNFRLNGSLPVNNLIDLPLENKDRVEVLKGSSALYYGFTNPSGIVNMVTKRARLEPTNTFVFTANEFGGVSGHADIGRKFGADKQFGLRLNASHGKLRSGTKGFDGERTFGSAAFDWRLTDDLALRLDVELIEKSAVEQAAIALLPAVAGVISLPRIPDSTKLLSGPWAEYAAEAQNVLARVDYRISDAWAATLETGRAETDRDRSFSDLRNYNLDTGEGSLRIQRGVDQVFINKNARLELAGKVLTGQLEHELSLGFTENRRFGNGRGVQTFTVAQNMYAPRPIAEPQITQAPTFNAVDITDKGFYAFDRITLSAAWQVLAGVRSSTYTNQSKSARIEVREKSPSAGVIFKPRPDTSVYATYIEGLEEGGIAPSTAVNAFDVLPPAVTKQKELGVRTEAIARVLLSGAYFTIDRASALLNKDNRFVLDGRADYRGVELSASGAATAQLSIYASALLLDAQQTSAANAALIGKVPENTARRTFSLFGEYRLDGVPGLAVNAGVFYTGARAVNPLNQAFIPGYALFSLGARYNTVLGGHKVSMQANLDNAADKRYWSAGGSGLLAVGAPRALKATLKVDF